MSEQDPAQPVTPPAEPEVPEETTSAETGQDEPDSQTDQEQGVGVAPTEPGDAGEGNPGTAFKTTEEIEQEDLSKSGEASGVN